MCSCLRCAECPPNRQALDRRPGNPAGTCLPYEGAAGPQRPRKSSERPINTKNKINNKNINKNKKTLIERSTTPRGLDIHHWIPEAHREDLILCPTLGHVTIRMSTAMDCGVSFSALLLFGFGSLGFGFGCFVFCFFAWAPSGFGSHPWATSLRPASSLKRVYLQKNIIQNYRM